MRAEAELDAIGDERVGVGLALDIDDALDVSAVLWRVDLHRCVAAALLRRRAADAEDARPLLVLPAREGVEAVGDDERAAFLDELRRRQLGGDEAVADVDLDAAPPVVVLLDLVLRQQVLHRTPARRRRLQPGRCARVDVGEPCRAFPVARRRVGEGVDHEVADGAVGDRRRCDVVHRRVVGVARPDARDEVRRVAVCPRLADRAAVLVRLARAGLDAPGAADAEGAAAVSEAERAGVGEDVVDHVGVFGIDDLLLLHLDAVVVGVRVEDGAVLARDLQDRHRVELAVAAIERERRRYAAHDAAGGKHRVGVRDIGEFDVDAADRHGRAVGVVVERRHAELLVLRDDVRHANVQRRLEGRDVQRVAERVAHGDRAVEVAARVTRREDLVAVIEADGRVEDLG